MSENTFRLINVFFININFKRINKLPEILNIPIRVEFKIIERVTLNQIQINLRIKSGDDTPISFDVELVGLYEFLGDPSDLNKDRIVQFILDKGLFMLWPYGAQMVRLISGQMGMNPLDTQTPISFQLSPEEIKDIIVERSVTEE